LTEPGEARRVVEKDREQHDEGGTEERAQNAAETADDDREQDRKERLISKALASTALV
jgi:hypothetical protein